MKVVKTIQKEIALLSEKIGISSMHILLPNKSELELFEKANFGIRSSYSFHWFNNNYTSFDDFLLELTSRQRKNIKKERENLKKQKISIERIKGRDITEDIWSQFYQFYNLTYLKRGMRPYLNLEFFLEISSCMPDSILLIMAKNPEGNYVAGALNFFDNNNLYGRYWGCLEEYNALHFEACYYQGIEFCIEEDLKRFDPGVQGEHKIKRGFWPIETFSAHWIKDERFREAISNFLITERKHVHLYKEQCKSLLPFKSSIIQNFNP